MKKKFMVSVVIPTHNRCDLLERAIISVINQTYPIKEINVVSDGSTDNTDEIVENLKKKFKNINYYSYQPGKGGNYARNYGIKKSTGDYIAFLDDDDEWHSEKIERQINILKSDENIGLVCCAINNVHIGGSESHVFIPPAKYDSSVEILIKNCIGSTTTVLVEKSLFKVAGLFDENLPALQDYDMWVRLCQITKIGVVEIPSVEYYNYENSNQISKNTYKYIDAEEKITKKYDDLIKTLSKKNQRRRKSYFHMLISKKGMRNGQMGVAIINGFKSLISYPSKNSLVCFVASFVPYNITMKLRKRLMKKGLN